ncbi:HD domain-containing protein [Pararhizobium sp. DWP3-4]|uniref:HD domain-containing protein n=1 Tax=unclassified Pararhizobium TaxID=2643050 RepID=UPI003CF6FF55
MTNTSVTIPDSKLARDVTQFIHDTESDLLFLHSSRVFFWGAIKGQRMDLKFDAELLYVAAMFHDIGLTAGYHDSQRRFEVDGAFAARDFLRAYDIPERDIEKVWNAIALHTTPGIPEHMHPEIFLVQSGAGMDVAGRGYDEFSAEQRDTVVTAFPRGADFNSRMIDAFYEGMKNRPHTTFGTFNDDFLALKDPDFKRVDLCSIIYHSPWDH